MRISRNKVLALALIASLAVNLVIGGFIAAQWAGHEGKRHTSNRLHFDHRTAVTVLDDQERERLKEFWKERRETLRPYFREFREDRNKLKELFTASILDIPAINETYAEMIEAQMRIETFLQTAMVDMAKFLPEDKRAAFFEQGFSSERNKPRPSRDSKDD